MNGADWLRFFPFAVVAFNLLCWAVIDTFSDRPWNVAKVTIVVTGYAVFVYIASLALNYSWLHIDYPDGYYDAIRLFMASTVVGSWFVGRNAWWAFKGWRERRRRERG